MKNRMVGFVFVLLWHNARAMFNTRMKKIEPYKRHSITKKRLDISILAQFL